MNIKNPYIENPLFIAHLDPNTGGITKAYFFLGDIPRNVLSAVKRVKGNFNKLDWVPADASILEEFYGTQWKKILTPYPPVKDVTSGLATTMLPRFFSGLNRFTGGATSDFDIFDDMEVSNESISAVIGTTSHRKVVENWSDVDTVPHYTNIAVYPEDTIFDIKLKLAAVSDIAVYRQHLFYYLNDEGPVLPYNFTVDGSPVAIDWRNLAKHTESSKTHISGLSIDQRLEERHEGIKIEALDTFTRLSSIKGVRVTSMFFVDLYSVIPPLTSSHRRNDGLISILKDKYQFDLLYYGCLIKFWPMLNSNMCNAALHDPSQMSRYPKLYTDPAALNERFTLEREIADRAICWSKCSRASKYTAAVTSISLKIAPSSIKMRLSLRNIFDWLAVDANIIAVKARFSIDAALLPPQTESRQGDLVTISAMKRHASSFMVNNRAAMESFNSLCLCKDAIVIMAPIHAISATGIVSPVLLTVYSNGQIEAETEWREDQMMTFESAKIIIIDTITPIVERINDMGLAAAPTGGVITVNKMITLGAVNVSLFWPNILSSVEFKELRSLFINYERAGIITIKSIQQPGIFAFSFLKGIIMYNSRVMERADSTLRGVDTTLNQYAWLNDENVAVRWAQLFHGRTIRIYHRVTDIKIEVVGAESTEFDLIRTYVYSLLDLMRKNTAAAAAPASTKTLKRLQEKDPFLYDLKKYDPNATVYSVLCQSGRQPVMYDEDEIGKTNKKLTKYWNFTKSRPAYYECPNKAFSHLSFRSGQHPMGYCLPCCKKTLPSVDSRSAKVNADCLAKRTSTIEDDEEMLSRHILAYGKPIPTGRISMMGMEGLFLDVTPPTYGLYLIGVEQSTAAIPDAGYVYSLAYLLSDSDPDAVIVELAELAAAMEDTYYSLGGGAGALFSSSRELSDAILGAFVRRDIDFSPFGPGGVAHGKHCGILSDLASYIFMIDIVNIYDTGSTTLEFGPSLRDDTKIGIIVHNEGGIYPVSMLNPNFYLRVSFGDRWMAARRVFASDGYIGDTNIPDDAIIDSVMDTIRKILAFSKVDSIMNLQSIEEYSKHGKFKIYTLLINFKNLCWGVLMRAETSTVFIPVIPSEYTLTGIDLHFGAQPDNELPIAELKRAIEDINKWRLSRGESEIIPKSHIKNNKSRYIGFVSQEDLYFIHTESDQPVFSAADVVTIPYDMQDIDEAIVMKLKNLDADTEQTSFDQLRISAELRNNLYRLFLVEFSTEVKKGRNHVIREQLLTLINKTKFDISDSLSNLRRGLLEILGKYPEDLRVIRDIISRGFVVNPQNPNESIISSFNDTIFKFDNIVIEQLQKLGHGETIQAVKEMLKSRIEVGEIKKLPDNWNIYTPCSEKGVSTGACHNGKLVVPPDRIDELYDILAYDIHNTGKSSILSTISSGVFDPLNFIRRPGEHLTIKLL